jgi:hypothetical protein
MQDEYLKFEPKALVDENNNILIDLSEGRMRVLAQRRFTLRAPQLEELKDEITKPTIAIAYVNVYKIPNDKLDETIRDDNFEYFKVEGGMNINVPKGKIKMLRFYLSLYGDGKQSEDVLALDGFPNDKIKYVKVVSGKITLSINKLLKIIPSTTPISDLLGIELDAWEINWGYDKLEVGFSEALNYNLDWYLSSDNVNQSFQFYITLKKRKTINKVTAIARAIWIYEPSNPILATILRNAQIKSDEKEIHIIT